MFSFVLAVPVRGRHEINLRSHVDGLSNPLNADRAAYLVLANPGIVVVISDLSELRFGNRDIDQAASAGLSLRECNIMVTRNLCKN